MDQTVSTRQFVIQAGQNHPGANGLAPIGSRGEILRDLFNHNTGPETEGDDVLYGPGITIELTPGQDPVTQMLLTINEEEIGWQVVQRLGRKYHWRLVDPNTGRVLEL